MLRLLRDWILPLPPRNYVPSQNNSISTRSKSTLEEHHTRRKTYKYKKKQGIVKSVWITMGLVMLTYPVLPFVVALSLLTTFLSFVILDETP